MAALMTPTFCSIHHLHTIFFCADYSIAAPRRQSVNICFTQQESNKRLVVFNLPCARRRLLKPTCATRSGLETTVGDLEGSSIKLRKVEIAVESKDAEKMKLRVNLPGEETQKAFDILLSKLAQSAPATPGFRMQKGGKTSKVPKSLLIDILGRDLVMKFVIREIVTSAVANHVKQENLSVRDNKINTTQTEDELKQSFSPGAAFGFNVELELETEETEAIDTVSQI